MMFAAATSSDSLRNSLISSVHSFVFSPRNTTPIGPIYDPTTGIGNSVGINSPAMGAMFAALALNKPLHSNNVGPSSSPGTPSGSGNREADPNSSFIAPVVGGVVGGLLFLGVIGTFFWYKKKKTRTDPSSGLDPFVSPPDPTRPAVQTGVRDQARITHPIVRKERAFGPPPSYTEFQ